MRAERSKLLKLNNVNEEEKISSKNKYNFYIVSLVKKTKRKKQLVLQASTKSRQIKEIKCKAFFFLFLPLIQ